MSANVFVLSLAVAALCAQALPTFTTGSHGVDVPVAVFDGDRVVENLGIRDFEIRDNGALQTITTADFSVLPINLRLVFDTSGSISEDDLAQYLHTMRQVAGALEPKDLCEIITFSSRITQAADRQSPPIAINLTRVGPDGTAFIDAVSLALVTAPTPDRRQITIVLSDARDNASFFDEDALLDVARRTDAVVYTVLPGDPKLARAVSVARLGDLSAITGGRLLHTPKQTEGSVVNEAIREFRHSYILRYTLEGPAIEGWHKLEVRVRGGNGYRIRAKEGYFGR